MKHVLVPCAILTLVMITGCNLPGSHLTPTVPPEAILTQVAQTISAQLTKISEIITPTFPNLPTSSITPSPSAAPIYTPSQTPVPCLLVGYSDATIDVTVPDNTSMSPNQAFTKTWRLKNIGTCIWNSSYQLVFDRQDDMGVPSNYSQPLTTGTVTPGQEVDVSVNLIAPGTRGTYTGYWRFRDPNGIYFGIGGSSAWIVKIKVVDATTLTPTP